MMLANNHATEEVLTLEEFQRLPDEGAGRVELVRGRLVRHPPNGALHGDIAARLCSLLGSYARETGLGRVVILAGFLLERNPPTVRQPDVAFLREESLPRDGVPKGYWPLAPDLDIEIVSPSDTASAMTERVLQLLEAGTRLVWIVYPSTRSVTVHRSRGNGSILMGDDRLEDEVVLPNFQLRVSDVFALD